MADRFLVTATTVTQPGEEADHGDAESDHLEGETQVDRAPDICRRREEASRPEEDEKETGQHAEARDPGTYRTKSVDLD